MSLRWIVLCLICLAACSESDDTRKHRFLLKGNAELADQHEEMALQYFTEALKIDSCFADAHNNLGTLYFRQKDYGQAVEFYTRAIGCQPNFLPAYFNRANAFYESGKPEMGLIDIRHFLKAKPDTVPAVFLEGLIHTQQRTYPEAIRAFNRVLKLDSSNTEARINLGTVYYYQDSIIAAKRILSDVIAVNPKAGDAYNVLALISADERDYSLAFTYIDHALTVNGQNFFYRNNKGYIHLMNGERDKAVHYIDYAIVNNPYNSYAYRNKGIYYLFSNDVPNAIRMFNKAIELDAYTDQVYAYLAEAYMMDNQKSKACDAFVQSVKHREHIRTVVRPDCR